MKETWYHFIFDNDTFLDKHGTCETTFKDIIYDLAVYHGDASEMFRKCLNGYDEEDIAGIVELYNHFAYTDIGEIYVIEKAIYPNKE